MSETKYKLMELPIGKIKPSLDNPRKTFNTERLKELVESIKSIDLMDEIVVRSTDNNHYEIINGERRWRAEREILGNEGLLKVRVYNVDAVTAQEMRLTELSQREDVDQIEVENAVYKYWIVRGRPSYSEIVGKTGFNHSTIRNYIAAGKERFPQDEGTPSPDTHTPEPQEELFEVSSDDLKYLRSIKDKAPTIYDELLKARAAGLITQDELRNRVNEIRELEPSTEDTLATIRQKKKAQEQKPKEQPIPTGSRNKRNKSAKKQQPKEKTTPESIKDKAPKIYDELKKAKKNGLITKEKEEKLVKKVQEDPAVTSEDTLKDVTKREKSKEKPKQEKTEEWLEGLWEGYKKEQDEHKAWLETPEGRKRIEVSENAHRHLHLQNAIVEDTNDVHIFCPNCGKGKEFLGWMCCHTPADKAVEMAYEQHQKDIDEKGRKTTDP